MYSSVEDFIRKVGGKTPIRRVLIANNGIAAVKAIRSIRSWAYDTFGDERVIQFTVMATPDDIKANAEFIRMADSFVEIPGGSNNNNYANVNLITEIAADVEADAVWAGWGHASENPLLPTSLANSPRPVVFIGPPAGPMHALGDKIGSTLIAQSAGVSVIPWNGDGLRVNYRTEGMPESIYEQASIKSLEEAKSVAARIGFPLMIKASEGGGGKGIRKVLDMETLPSSFRQVQGEVPGSPIFIMKLASNARHLEVQLLADQYGNAVPLFGRDCSVQRRHQKIIEEGPVTAAPPEIWAEMERAAVRLAKEVGYVNAGTVEYLYMEETSTFAFLELNPRLQVEHPVTEMVSGVNLPAAQLQVAMGVPLWGIADIRKLYNQNPVIDLESAPESAVKIDFDVEPRRPPEGHVIAARITAENPDSGFQPTSGAVTELNFRSTPDVWGYFSVDSSGRVHEFADSQFGHIFAWGLNRETARRKMVRALKEISIRGDIRTTVEYLSHLLESTDFSSNKISTSWLDSRISAKVRTVKPRPLLIAAAGALFRAWGTFQDRRNQFLECLRRGQPPPPSLTDISLTCDLIYDDTRFSFLATQSGPQTITLACQGAWVQASVRSLSDGGLLASLGGHSLLLYGREDPSGLRLTLDGHTCEFSQDYDPTKIRAQMSGKLARLIAESGTLVKKGEPFAEIEVMKMFLALTMPEDGVLTFARPEGSVLAPGDLIATVDLSDPTRVKRARVFSGSFSLADLGILASGGASVGGTAHDESSSFVNKAGNSPAAASSTTNGALVPSTGNPRWQNRLKASQQVLTDVMAGFVPPREVYDAAWSDFDAAFSSPDIALKDVEEVLAAIGSRLPATVLSGLRETIKDYKQRVEQSVAHVRNVVLAAAALDPLNVLDQPVCAPEVGGSRGSTSFEDTVPSLELDAPAPSTPTEKVTARSLLQSLPSLPVLAMLQQLARHAQELLPKDAAAFSATAAPLTATLRKYARGIVGARRTFLVSLLRSFLSVEMHFADGKRPDEAVAELRAACGSEPDESRLLSVFETVRAHAHMKQRKILVLSLLARLAEELEISKSSKSRRSLSMSHPSALPSSNDEDALELAAPRSDHSVVPATSVDSVVIGTEALRLSRDPCTLDEEEEMHCVGLTRGLSASLQGPMILPAGVSRSISSGDLISVGQEGEGSSPSVGSSLPPERDTSSSTPSLAVGLLVRDEVDDDDFDVTRPLQHSSSSLEPVSPPAPAGVLDTFLRFPPPEQDPSSLASMRPLLHDLAELRAAEFGEITLEARQILVMQQQPSQKERREGVQVLLEQMGDPSALLRAGRFSLRTRFGRSTSDAAHDLRRDHPHPSGFSFTANTSFNSPVSVKSNEVVDSSQQSGKEPLSDAEEALLSLREAALSALIDDDQPLLDVLMGFFAHPSPAMRLNAAEVYIRRLYRNYAVGPLNSVQLEHMMSALASSSMTSSFSSEVSRVVGTAGAADFAHLNSSALGSSESEGSDGAASAKFFSAMWRFADTQASASATTTSVKIDDGSTKLDFVPSSTSTSVSTPHAVEPSSGPNASVPDGTPMKRPSSYHDLATMGSLTSAPGSPVAPVMRTDSFSPPPISSSGHSGLGLNVGITSPMSTSTDSSTQNDSSSSNIHTRRGGPFADLRTGVMGAFPSLKELSQHLPALLALVASEDDPHEHAAASHAVDVAIAEYKASVRSITSASGSGRELDLEGVAENTIVESDEMDHDVHVDGSSSLPSSASGSLHDSKVLTTPRKSSSTQPHLLIHSNSSRKLPNLSQLRETNNDLEQVPDNDVILPMHIFEELSSQCVHVVHLFIAQSPLSDPGLRADFLDYMCKNSPSFLASVNGSSPSTSTAATGSHSKSGRGLAGMLDDADEELLEQFIVHQLEKTLIPLQQTLLRARIRRITINVPSNRSVDVLRSQDISGSMPGMDGLNFASSSNSGSTSSGNVSHTPLHDAGLLTIVSSMLNTFHPAQNQSHSQQQSQASASKRDRSSSMLGSPSLSAMPLPSPAIFFPLSSAPSTRGGFPWIYTFRAATAFQEDAIVRHIEPPSSANLELRRMVNFRVKIVPSANRVVHVYSARPRDGASGNEDESRLRYFVRAIVRQTTRVPTLNSIYEQYPGPERMFVECLDSLDISMGDTLQDTSSPVGNNHIFLNILPVAPVGPEFVESVVKILAKRYSERLRRLRVSQVEFKINLQPVPDGPIIPLRLVSSNPTGFVLRVDTYVETRVPGSVPVFVSVSFAGTGVHAGSSATGLEANLFHSSASNGSGSGNGHSTNSSGPGHGLAMLTASGARRSASMSPSHSPTAQLVGRERSTVTRGPWDGKPVNYPYPVASPFSRRRALAAAISDTVFVYDFPELLARALEIEWTRFLKSRIPPELSAKRSAFRPRSVMRSVELVLRPKSASHGRNSSMGGPTVLTDSGALAAILADSKVDASTSTGNPTSSNAKTASEEVFGRVLAEDDTHELVEVFRAPGRNNIGMVAWHMRLCTPEYNAQSGGREIIVIANDITFRAGSFGTKEDHLFALASLYARKRGIPRIYVAANSGARIGLSESVKKLFRVAWVDNNDPSKGFKYFYLTRADAEALCGKEYIQSIGREEQSVLRFSDSAVAHGQAQSQAASTIDSTGEGSDSRVSKRRRVILTELDNSISIHPSTGAQASNKLSYPPVLTYRCVEASEERFVLTDILGKEADLGVENLRGSGRIAGETARAYESNSFTLAYVTGRTVGIGAYLVRLGHRTIQKVSNAPIILTGFEALNKLMGSDVYTSNEQLGGPRIMYANGVSHEIVNNDFEGVSAILQWLSFVPKQRDAPLPILEMPLGESVDRPVQYTAPASNYFDPRLLLTGAYASTGAAAAATTTSSKATKAESEEFHYGLLDRGSFREYLAGWAKSVIVGRGRLGGVPIGVITPEIRSTSTIIPADAATPSSKETIVQQAGGVWFPESAFKTAQALRDFSHEQLPVLIIANWRGFSGGQRDMFDSVLKYGSYIVDALVSYSQPVMVYIPPGGALRGGAWVVVDPTINEDSIELYADSTGRGGVLEPAGTAAIKFRAKEYIQTAHRLDDRLIQMDAELASLKATLSNQADMNPNSSTSVAPLSDEVKKDLTERMETLKKDIKKREVLLSGTYLQLSHAFADLHDTPGRMRATGVIRGEVPWESARTFFYWRLRRKLSEGSVIRGIISSLNYNSSILATQGNAGSVITSPHSVSHMNSYSGGGDQVLGGPPIHAPITDVSEKKNAENILRSWYLESLLNPITMSLDYSQNRWAIGSGSNSAFGLELNTAVEQNHDSPMAKALWADDRKVLSWISDYRDIIEAKTRGLRKRAIVQEVIDLGMEDPNAVVVGILDLLQRLPNERREAAIATLRRGVLFGNTGHFSNDSSLEQSRYGPQFF